MTDELDSNTAEIVRKPRSKGVPFFHGDPRINRKGRPKSFDELRKLAVLVAAEQDEAGINRALEILRDWAKSKEVNKQTKFMEYSYGKVPDQIENKNSGVITLKVVYKDERVPDNTPPPAPEAG